MSLVFIHGAPAAGKLTVAKELFKITGYKIFHNHLTMDLVKSIFKKDTKLAYSLIKEIRLLVLKTAAKEGINGIIFTFSDVSGDNYVFSKKVLHAIEKQGGNVFFVRLFCKKEELFRRVGNGSRKKFEKFTKRSLLEKALKKWNFEKIVPFKETLQIDNTNLSAKKVAIQIKQYFKLK